MAGVLARIPLFQAYRRFGRPRMLPLNITISPSPKCNSRCLTCNIWMKREDELTLEEWDKVLASLGNAPYWFTISGGEPLMYPGIVELAKLAYTHNKPGIINIPTNAILKSGPERVEQILASCPEKRCSRCRSPWHRQTIRQLGHLAIRGELRPSCACGRWPEAGVVLDPFIGSGTTALVAEAHGRNWLGIELNPTFAELAEERIRSARVDAKRRAA